MKHLKISLLLLVCISLMLVGCQSQIDGGTSDKQNDDTNLVLGEPGPSISVRSIAALEEMRKMISCTDEKELKQYLQSVEGGGANSKEDLEKFIKLVDAIPYIPLIDGDISWINCSSGISEDTGKQTSVLFVTTKSQSGEWIRFEYNLMAVDASATIDEKLSQMSETEILIKPIQSKDKKLTVYSESRDEQTIVWTVNIDGVFARVIYHTNTPDEVNASDMFSNGLVSRIN